MSGTTFSSSFDGDDTIASAQAALADLRRERASHSRRLAALQAEHEQLEQSAKELEAQVAVKIGEVAEHDEKRYVIKGCLEDAFRALSALKQTEQDWEDEMEAAKSNETKEREKFRDGLTELNSRIRDEQSLLLAHLDSTESAPEDFREAEEKFEAVPQKLEAVFPRQEEMLGGLLQFEGAFPAMKDFIEKAGKYAQ